ncbi:hypothetical protein BEP19_06530 [Ammoniphilus oxalaticus]|uniref:Uncharacterized protein n=2 Tax=Ammoniphilus oxalaticus TaxID=66863 RepID=A0A419SJD2_9BACL|nr:hypothetical protein BEP19_06530 [Ammoniphilus oxalaticus]
MFAPMTEASVFMRKYENKVSEFVQLHLAQSTYANIVIAEELKYNESTKQYSLVSPFNAVRKGQKLTPNLFSNIFDAPVSESLPLEIAVLDPSNNLIQSKPLSVNTRAKNTKLTLITTLDPITFDKIGDYKVQLFIRWNGEKVRIGQTIIVSR